MRHPELDLRPWLERHPGAINAYSAGRIAKSYARVSEVLAACPQHGHRSAFDVGCSAGHESFAFGAHFDRVLAVDPNSRSIRQARRVAKRAGVTTVTFERADVEKYEPRGEFDLVYCNGMSHEASSRCELLEKLHRKMSEGAWLVYMELSEGYGPRALHRAVARRDQQEVQLRVRQVLNGLCGRPEYRFFLSGSLSDQLDQLGLEVSQRDVESWNSLPVNEVLWCGATRRGDGHSRAWDDQDYARLDPHLTEIRGRVLSIIAARDPRTGLTGGQHGEIEQWAEQAPNPLAPFLLFLLIAEEVPRAYTSRTSAVERARQKGPGFLKPRAPDWERLIDLDRAFLSLVQRRTGTQGVPVED